MDELETFFHLFLHALGKVEQSYFETVLQNVSALRGSLSHLGKFIDEDFVRSGERVFVMSYIINSELNWIMKKRQILII